LQVVEKVAEK